MQCLHPKPTNTGRGAMLAPKTNQYRWGCNACTQNQPIQVGVQCLHPKPTNTGRGAMLAPKRHQDADLLFFAYFWRGKPAGGENLRVGKTCGWGKPTGGENLRVGKTCGWGKPAPTFPTHSHHFEYWSENLAVLQLT